MEINKLDSFYITIINSPLEDILNFIKNDDFTKNREFKYKTINIDNFFKNNISLNPTSKLLIFESITFLGKSIALGGWITLINYFCKKQNKDNYFIEFNTDKSPIQRNCFFKFEKDNHSRIIQNIINEKEKWEFFSKGKPLKFKKKEYYRRKEIKNRLNKDILIEYSKNIGFDLLDELSFVTNKKSIFIEY